VWIHFTGEGGVGWGEGGGARWIMVVIIINGCMQATSKHKSPKSKPEPDLDTCTTHLFDVHGRREQPARVPNVDGGLHLVPCQDPGLDARGSQGRDGVWHPHLQLVLYGSSPQNDKVRLYHSCNSGQPTRPVQHTVHGALGSRVQNKTQACVTKRGGGRSAGEGGSTEDTFVSATTHTHHAHTHLVLNQPPVRLHGSQVPPAQHQRAQAQVGEVQQVLHQGGGGLLLGREVQHHIVRALDEEGHLAPWAPDHHGHALAGGVKRVDAQDLSGWRGEEGVKGRTGRVSEQGTLGWGRVRVPQSG
jgi:hypothetical protein